MNRGAFCRIALLVSVASIAAPTTMGAWQPGGGGAGRTPEDDWFAKAQAEIVAMEYAISWAEEPADGGGACFQAPNRAQNLRFLFRDHGAVHVVDRTGEPQWSVSLTPRELGRGLAAQEVGPAAPEHLDTMVSYRHAGLMQILTNEPGGLVQEMIVDRPPRGEGELRVEVLVEGDVTLHRDGLGGLELSAGADRVLALRRLEAVDAAGTVRAASAHARMDGSGFTVVVDDEGALYPLNLKWLLSLPTAAEWVTAGPGDYASHGFSVATAGDVNGDGYSDAVVGARGVEAGGNIMAGAAYVYYGSAAGLPTSPSWQVTGSSAWEELGHVVATAGDVNGDGYADLAIAAPGYRDPSTGDAIGAVFVYHGSSGGLGGSPDWTRDDAHGHVNGGFGAAVATAGDVNGDGYSDLLIGQPYYDSDWTDEGWAGLFMGSSTGLTFASSWNRYGHQDGEFLGAAVATAGDVNGDGYADFMISSPGYTSALNSDCGFVDVYLGSSTGPQFPPIAIIGGQDGARLGEAISTAGDVNGDGYADIIVGVPGYDTALGNEGVVFVYYGASTFDNSSDWFAFGETQDGAFGSSVSFAGDVNGDGYADVLVGEPAYSGAQQNEGRVLMWLGSPAGPAIGTPGNADWTVTSGAAYARMGAAVATAGDVNGDGYSDVVVGAPDYSYAHSYEGVAFAFYGGPDTLAGSAHWGVESDWGGARLGFSVAAAGDVNGDGFADLLAGAPYYDSSFADEGAVLLYHGSSTGPSTIHSWFAKGGQEGANFGWAVATAGDVNGDGYSDVIIGAPNYDYSAVDSGGIFVYFGSSDGMGSEGSPANADWWAISAYGGGHMGYSASTAGDVNGDGYADVAAGTPNWANGQTDEGAVFVWHGAADGLGPNGDPGNADWKDEGDTASLILGTSVAPAGDVNADGHADLIAGGFNIAVVWHGSPAGLTSPGVDWAMAQGSSAHLFGRSVAGAGDVNGDGYSDVIVGAPTYTQYYSGEGAAWAYCGSSSGLASSACWWDTGYRENAYLGMSVASAGDLNGDGYADIATGAPGWSNGQSNEGQARVYYGSSMGPISFNDGDWKVESNRIDDVMGASVAGVGDVNGDGYGDLVVGHSGYTNGQGSEGRLSLFYGNGRPGVSVRLRQLASDGSSPIAPLGRSDSETEFYVRMGARDAAGRGPLQLATELKRVGSPFDGGNLNLTTVYDPSSVGGVVITQSQEGLNKDVAYHWRTRVLLSPVDFPFSPPRSRWYHLAYNGFNELDLRTAGTADELPSLIFMDGFESGDTTAWQ